MTKIIERRGNQIYVEYEDCYGNLEYEWQYDPVSMCACGSKEVWQCREAEVTTFMEKYECGFVHRYHNANGLPDVPISKKGKSVRK